MTNLKKSETSRGVTGVVATSSTEFSTANVEMCSPFRNARWLAILGQIEHEVRSATSKYGHIGQAVARRPPDRGAPAQTFEGTADMTRGRRSFQEPASAGFGARRRPGMHAGVRARTRGARRRFRRHTATRWSRGLGGGLVEEAGASRTRVQDRAYLRLNLSTRPAVSMIF